MMTKEMSLLNTNEEFYYRENNYVDTTESRHKRNNKHAAEYARMLSENQRYYQNNRENSKDSKKLTNEFEKLNQVYLQNSTDFEASLHVPGEFDIDTHEKPKNEARLYEDQPDFKDFVRLDDLNEYQ